MRAGPSSAADRDRHRRACGLNWHDHDRTSDLGWCRANGQCGSERRACRGRCLRGRERRHRNDDHRIGGRPCGERGLSETYKGNEQELFHGVVLFRLDACGVTRQFATHINSIRQRGEFAPGYFRIFSDSIRLCASVDSVTWSPWLTPDPDRGLGDAPLILAGMFTNQEGHVECSRQSEVGIEQRLERGEGSNRAGVLLETT